MTVSVHQLLPVLSYGDAIGGTVLQLQAMLRELGLRSEVYAELVDDRLAGRALPASALLDDPPDPDDAVMYHLSIGSPAMRVWERCGARRILFYPNVTPPHFYRGINARVTHQLAMGLRDLRRAVPRAELVLTHSTFSLDEARELGMRRGAVVPVCDAERLGTEPAVPPSPPVVLYVGRCAPNKRLEDLLRGLAALRATAEPEARLVLAGSAHDCEPYARALTALAGELGVRDAVELPGEHRRTDAQVAALYRSASVYASASVHEGFCVPLVEAMAHRLPIVARAAAAVPETVGDAGLLVDGDDPMVWAATLARAIGDATLRATLAANAARQLRRFEHGAVRARLEAALTGAGIRPDRATVAAG